MLKNWKISEIKELSKILNDYPEFVGYGIKEIIKEDSLSFEEIENARIEEMDFTTYKIITDSSVYFIYREYEDLEYDAKMFLIDNPELWKEAVQSGYTEDSLSDWVDEVVRYDDPALILGGELMEDDPAIVRMG